MVDDTLNDLTLILTLISGGWVIYSLIKLLWIDRQPKPWSKLTATEKRLIAKTVERQRAFNTFLASIQAADRGDYEDAVNLAGDTRHLLRQIAREGKHDPL